MQIINGTTSFMLEGKSAVAIGKFDGIHLGHQRLLSHIIKQKERGYLAVVFTFDPAPSVYFGWSDGKELMTREEKLTAFENKGIDIVVEYPMNDRSAAILPEDFVTQILVKKLHAAYIVAGADVSFGYKGAGNSGLLKKMSQHHDFEIKIIEKVCCMGRDISSSYARESVESGNMELATSILGYSYFVGGKVIAGQQLGRTIGMPTLNIWPKPSKLLPPNGVYFSEVIMEGKRYNAITNIGCKPTVSDKQMVGVETYLYEYSGNAYGKEITVLLHSYHRPEMKFSGKEELKKRMEVDLLAGLLFHKTRITGNQ